MAKIRTGFVSNSSSSSFVCDITGVSFEGYDGEYECTYAQCVKGHEFAADDCKEVMDWIANGDEDGDGDQYDIPEKLCPICNGTSKNVIITRIMKDLARFNIDVKDLK